MFTTCGIIFLRPGIDRQESEKDGRGMPQRFSVNSIKLEPEEIMEYLSQDLGICVVEKKDSNGNAVKELSLDNQKKFPSVSYRKKEQDFKLFYQGPQGMGEQSFKFDIYPFLCAFNDSKFAFKDPGKSFEHVFFELSYPKANPFVRLIFALFSITPTVLHRALAQDKKRARRLVLKPKVSSVYSAFGLHYLPPKKTDSESRKIQNENPDRKARIRTQQEEQRKEKAKSEMLRLVRQAASDYSFSYFDMWVQEYMVNKGVKWLSKTKRDRAFQDFKSQVKTAQKAQRDG